MSVSLSVTLVRGIDYGAEQGGDPVAWAWYDAEIDKRRSPDCMLTGDGCDVCDHSTSDVDGIPILVVYASESEEVLWRDSGATGASTADVLALIGKHQPDESVYDASLRAYCEKRGLPRREPRWIVTINNV